MNNGEGVVSNGMRVNNKERGRHDGSGDSRLPMLIDLDNPKGNKGR